MTELERDIYSLGIVPVVTLHEAAAALPLASALTAGGLPLAEITFRTPAAAESIRTIRQAAPGMLVGAGTISSIPLAREALEAGASFIVTPGFSPEVVRWCIEQAVPVYPGCTTASEVEAAMNMGLSIVKFFPAEQSGGLPKIKALCAPYPTMRFMPTGGVGLGNLQEYLAFPKIFACGGSFMVSDALIAAKRWDEVERLSRQAVRTAIGLKLAAVGLGVAPGESAGEMAAKLGSLLSQETGEGENGRRYIGNELELLPAGTAGELVYESFCLERAYCWLERQGFSIDQSGVSHDAAKRLSSIRVQERFGGFAFRVRRIAA